MKIGIIAASLLLTALLQDPLKPDIAWTFKPGEKVRYEIEKSVVLHGKMGTVEMVMKFGLLIDSDRADGAGITPLKITIDRVVVSGKDAKEEESYDSDRDKDGPKHPSMKIMAGALNGTFEAKLSREGVVSDVSGLKEIFEKSAEQVAEVKERGDKEAGARFAESTLQLLREGFTLAAGKPLAKGDTWETKLPATPYGNGEAPLQIKSTVKELRKGEAVISRELTFDFTKDERNPDGKGSGKGELIWSTESGRLISGRWSTHVTIKNGESTATCVIKLAPREKK